MEKAGIKTRDIQFFSPKNNAMICIHTRQARDYAKYLEEQPWVAGYEAGRPLEQERYAHVSPVGIRASYFQTPWVSDFFIKYADGRLGIRELTSEENLRKQAIVERLEFSRRYWMALNIDEWRVVVAKADLGGK